MGGFDKPDFPHNIPPNEPTVPFPDRPKKRLDFGDKTVRLPRSLAEAVEMSDSVDTMLTNIRRIFSAAEDKQVLERGGKIYPLADGLIEAGIQTWRTPNEIPVWVTPEMRAKLIEWMGTV